MSRDTTPQPAPAIAPLQVIDLGRLRYAPAFEKQRQVHEAVLEGHSPPTVLLVEHEPVVTISNRDSAAGHLLAGPAQLEKAGVEVQPTDRGGDITYHGPGQLVAYPIIPLNALGLNVRQYVRMLEQSVIDTLAVFGVQAERDACAVGVWVPGASAAAGDDQGNGPACSQLPRSAIGDPRSAKIAAIGVRVRRWVSMHGLALNVTTNLDHFKLIVPCGLQRPVTSLQQILGENCPPMDAVKRTLVDALRKNLRR
jgi:lipoyl(octanoyl) transferase